MPSHGSDPTPQTSRVSLPTDFPVDKTPRPIVLTGPAVNDPATGFTTGDQKRAYLGGNVALAAPMPATTKAADGQRITSAAEALRLLRASGGAGGGVNDGKDPSTPPPITAIALSAASFDTDRGTRTLPAWEFRLAGVTHPAYVLAVESSALWPERTPDSSSVNAGSIDAGPVNSGSSAVQSADGKSITFSFEGTPAGPSPCGATYRASTKEAAAYVEIFADEVKPNPLGTTKIQACPAVGQVRTVVAVLKAPLGNRILIDAAGRPVSVT